MTSPDESIMDRAQRLVNGSRAQQLALWRGSLATAASSQGAIHRA
jgi:hypothetical protein